MVVSRRELWRLVVNAGFLLEGSSLFVVALRASFRLWASVMGSVHSRRSQHCSQGTGRIPLFSSC